MRSKYGTYPEYHTSLDDLSLISPAGLEGAYRVLRRCLEIIEANRVWEVTMPCEPQLGKRGLYPTLSTRDSGRQVHDMMNFLAYADGDRDLLEIAERIDVDVLDCAAIAERLEKADVVRAVDRARSREA
jgi:aminopeptidase-like protein